MKLVGATIVIAGGGAAGAPAARSLRRKLGAEHRIILVEQKETLVNPALLPLYAVGKKKRRHFSRERSRMSLPGIELTAGRVLKIDPGAKKVYTGGEEIDFDLLLIATGAELDRSRPPGAAEAGIDLQSLEGAEKIYAALPYFRGTEIAIVAPSAGIKCPAGPYEYALLLENWFNRRGRSRDISITIYTSESAPLILFGERTSRALAELLLKRRIRLHPGARIRRIDGESKTIFVDRDRFSYDLLLYYAPVTPPPLVGESGLAGKGGWLRPDPRTMALPLESSIFAAGDVTAIDTPRGELLPKLGAIAHLQSLVAAANIARLVKGQKPDRAYCGFAG
ncbi:MAG: FAD-dependent oxidoreductase [Firmicutes bacterium]|nr:FAD-dependent oxidoreductase [Bacillota bacterium]